VDYPPELADVREPLHNTRLLFDEGFTTFAPKWQKFLFEELYSSFYHNEFPGQPGYLSVEQFLTELQRRTDAYQRGGGEAGLQ
jgi:hypothetical protein